jgi:glycosyltransferase involved in cell wall biosynthesis
MVAEIRTGVGVSGTAVVGVVVPAHNEQALLQACLDSVVVARRRARVPVIVCVVLDRCGDASADVVDEFGARHRDVLRVEAPAPGVGAARRAGVEALRHRLGTGPTWICSTDADSTVPAHWISGQLAHAGRGADAVVGTVRVADWGTLPAVVRERYQAGYREDNGHRHIHGANLGFRLTAYDAAGGFGSQRTGEDVALIARLRRTGAAIVWAADLPVLTSARLDGRAPRGFAAYLGDLTRIAADQADDVVG